MDGNFKGVEFNASPALEMPDGVEVSDEAPKPRGFANPETLARAQATRAANKETGTPVGSFTDETPGTGKKRGRRPGTSAGASLDGIAEMLVGVHSLLSFLTTFPDLAIDKDEGLILAKGIAGIAEQYKVKIDGKASAFMGFIYAIAVVYGPRAILISKQIKERNNVRPDVSA